MRQYFILLVGIGLLSGVAGCRTDYPLQDQRQYPYYAAPERGGRILGGWQRLHPGMSQSEVVVIMGEPDEKNMVYQTAESFERREPDGEAWLYLLQRIQPYGGIHERREQSVRIEFDRHLKLQRVETAGIAGTDGDASSRRRRRTGFPGAAY